MTDSKGDRVREFFKAETEALVARFQNIQRLLPHEDRAGSAHPGEEGRFVEELVKSCLRRHLPDQVAVGTGFVLRVATKIGSDDNSRAAAEHDRHSRQLDVIIYDRARFPVYETFGDFVIVPPEAVIGAISVKKTLYSGQLEDELRALQEVATLCAQPSIRGPHIGLLAFQCEPERSPESLANHALKTLRRLSPCSFEALVNEVSIIQQFVLFKFLPDRDGSAPYRLICAQGADGHVVLQRALQSILGVFYDPTRQAAPARPGFVSFHKGAFGPAAACEVGAMSASPIARRTHRDRGWHQRRSRSERPFRGQLRFQPLVRPDGAELYDAYNDLGQPVMKRYHCGA